MRRMLCLAVVSLCCACGAGPAQRHRAGDPAACVTLSAELDLPARQTPTRGRAQARHRPHPESPRHLPRQAFRRAEGAREPQCLLIRPARSPRRRHAGGGRRRHAVRLARPARLRHDSSNSPGVCGTVSRSGARGCRALLNGDQVSGAGVMGAEPSTDRGGEKLLDRDGTRTSPGGISPSRPARAASRTISASWC